MPTIVKEELNEAVEKTSLGTRWNWTVIVNASDPRKCFGILADGRHYRVIEEIRWTHDWKRKSHFRIDVLGSLGMVWEALDSKNYRTPTGAARAVVKLHAAYLKQRRDRAVARINFT